MNALSTFFDKAFCINLDRRRDRWEQCQQEIKSQGLESLNIGRFPGYDHPTNGHQGCSRSHRMLLRLIAGGPWERVLIFEDDFQVITLDELRKGGFTPDNVVWKNHMSIPCGDNANDRFKYLSKFLPLDWDVIYLGAGYGEPPISRLNHHVIHCGFMQTTSSYGITREFAKVWTKKVDDSMGSADLERHPGPIDNVFGSMAKDHRYYVFQPRMFFQRKSKSDITGEENSYLFSMTDCAHEKLLP